MGGNKDETTTDEDEKNSVGVSVGCAVGVSAIASFIGLFCIDPRPVTLLGAPGMCDGVMQDQPGTDLVCYHEA